MKFRFETMRFLSKYMTPYQQITYLMTFHTYFTTFQTTAPRRITNKTLKIKQLSDKDGCFFLFCSRQNRHGFTLTVNQDVNRKPNERNN